MEDGIKLSGSDIAVLCSIYPMNQIFVREAMLYPQEREIVVTCAVPPGMSYTKVPIPYLRMH